MSPRLPTKQYGINLLVQSVDEAHHAMRADEAGLAHQKCSMVFGPANVFVRMAGATRY